MTGSPEIQRRMALWLGFGLVCLQAALTHQAQVLSLPHVRHMLPPDDGDNWLRLAIVRQWLADGSFLDHVIRKTNAPFGGILDPWTRLVDLPLAALAELLPRALPLAQRLMLAATWFPVALGVAVMGMLHRAAGGGAQALLCLLALAWLNMGTENYFAPGTADHHGPLCALWTGIVLLLLKPPGRAAGAGIGVLLGLMLWISVEALLPMAFVFAILGIPALSRPEAARAPALAASCAAFVSAAALLVQQPHDALSYIAYDSLSIVHVALLSFCAAGAALLHAVFPKIAGWRGRAAAAAATGAGVLLAMGALFPKFFLGPRVLDDPFIFTHLLASVSEARPVFALPGNLPALVLWQPLLAALLLALTCGARRTRRRTLLAVLLAGTFLPVLAAVRWTYYLQPVAMIIVASLLPAFAARKVPLLPRLYRPAALLLAVAALATLATGGDGHAATPREYCLADLRLALQDGTMTSLLGPGPRVLLAEPGESGMTQFFTPYSVVAGDYDREAEGLRDIALLDTPAPDAAVKAMLEKRRADAILMCLPGHPEDGWLYKTAMKRNPPVWLARDRAIDRPEWKGRGPVLFRVSMSSAAKASRRPSAAGSCGSGCAPPAGR